MLPPHGYNQQVHSHSGPQVLGAGLAGGSAGGHRAAGGRLHPLRRRGARVGDPRETTKKNAKGAAETGGVVGKGGWGVLLLGSCCFGGTSFAMGNSFTLGFWRCPSPPPPGQVWDLQKKNVCVSKVCALPCLGLPILRHFGCEGWQLESCWLLICNLERNFIHSNCRVSHDRCGGNKGACDAGPPLL